MDIIAIAATGLFCTPVSRTDPSSRSSRTSSSGRTHTNIAIKVLEGAISAYCRFYLDSTIPSARYTCSLDLWFRNTGDLLERLLRYILHALCDSSCLTFQILVTEK